MTTRIAIALLVAGTRFAQAECKPAAVPEGDPELVKNLSVRLLANGIATTSVAGCPTVTVSVEQRGDQLHLRLADAFQRRSERDVRDVATAAAIVESWTMQVIEEGSLPALRVMAPASPPPLAAAPVWPPSGLAISVGSALATNTTTWIGGGLAACTHLGPTCAGAALHATLDTRATGDTATILQDSYALAAFATVDVPLHAGTFTVTPGAGAGYGYTHIVTHHMDAMHNILDVPGHDHALATMVHVALARSLTTHAAIFADLAGAAALVRSDSTAGPGGSVWLAIGVRLEAP